MLEPISAHALFTAQQHALCLHWHGDLPEHDTLLPLNTPTPLAGLFDLAHSYPITVLGNVQLRTLDALSSTTYLAALQHLFATSPYLLVFAEQQDIPPLLLRYAQQHTTPIVSSPLDATHLVACLNQLGTSYLAQETRHGVFMEVLNIGVLLTGNSGIGKSELALGLIHCGHSLIADDAIILTRTTSDTLMGTCPPLLQDFLEVRGLGIINIRAMFGDKAIKDNRQLQFIVEVVSMNKKKLGTVNRLQGSHVMHRILGVNIPHVTIPVTPGRNLAVLVEAAVRNHILKLSGYDPNADFLQRQQKQLADNTP